MSSQNEQLEPTPFELAPQAIDQEQTTGSPPGWVIPALGGLALLALVVVFWLPNQVSEPSAQPEQTEQPANSENAAGVRTAREETDAPAGPQASPWSDAQAAKLRKEAQEVLQLLLDLQFALEERGAKQWAQEAYAQALAIAQSGDELYRDRQYIEAKEHYQQGLEQLQAINDSIPQVVDAQLQLACRNK
jgi:flagellar motor protein MotB